MADVAARPGGSARKGLKYALAALGVLVLAIAGLAGYFAATFDPRDYENYVVELVREKTGRTLTVTGEVALSFWPDLGVRLGGLSLSERTGDEHFLTIESARMTLELLPLLSDEIVASELVLDGANLAITRDEDGRLNIDDLFGGDGPAPRFDVGRVVLKRSAVVYRDLRTGARYQLTDLDLETGRVANVVETPLTVAVTMRDAADGAVVHAKLKTRLRLDVDRQQYGLTQALLELNGRVGGFPEFDATVMADAATRTQTNELHLAGVSVRARGLYGQDELKLGVKAAKIVTFPGTAAADDMRVTLAAKGPSGTSDLDLSVPSVRREGDRLHTPRATVDLTAFRSEHKLRAALSGALEASIAKRATALTQLDGNFTLTGPRVPRKGLAGAMKGDARLDLGKEGVQVNLAGKVDGVGVKARLTAAGFASPVYTFALDLDQLDLDRYLADTTPLREKVSNAETALLKPLADLPASGTITVGVLKSTHAKASNVRLEIK